MQAIGFGILAFVISTFIMSFLIVILIRKNKYKTKINEEMANVIFLFSILIGIATTLIMWN